MSLLHTLILEHSAMMRGDDPPVQLVAPPIAIDQLLKESDGEAPFERDGSGGYTFAGLPVALDVAQPTAVLMGSVAATAWRRELETRRPWRPRAAARPG